MLGIFLSWVAISIVFLSFGDFLIHLYNKLCRQDEQYGVTDTFLIGMCFTLIPLSITSFWLPSNHYILAAFILFSLCYWLIRKSHLSGILKGIKSTCRELSFYKLLFLIVPIVGIMIVIIWQVGVFDSLYYHQQNIRWNEEYAVVPGLGNLEHRFGFNSNYLLLSAVFSLRFLFGDAIYGLQALVLIYVICWIIKEIIDSGYEIKRIILLGVFTLYIFIFGYSLTATSTDAIPNIVAFYLIAKILLYPNALKNKLLLLFFIPVTLITFKISIVPLCLISLYILICLLKEKKYHITIFLCILSFIVVSLWLIRNVIITGYLVFPFYEIDIFNVDWKIPKDVAIEERDFILSCGVRIFEGMLWRFSHIEFDSWAIKDLFTNILLIGVAFVSPVVVIYSLIKKKYLDKSVYLIYFILFAIFIVWYSGGPDPRFIGGVLFGIVYFTLFLIVSTKEEKHFKKIGLTSLIFFSLLMMYWPYTRTKRFIYMFHLNTPREVVMPVKDIVYKQYPYRDMIKSVAFYVDDFEPYKLNNNITIYISRSTEIPLGRYVCFDDPFPCTVDSEQDLAKYLSIEDIEARGETLQDGFRVKAGRK